MENVKVILETEKKYRTVIMNRLKEDDRLAVSSHDTRYPEPLYIYIKSKKTEKTIALRIDGVDKTVRFWDYADDDYSDEDGVWGSLTKDGVEQFFKKLYKVMDHAVDVEYFGEDGECEDYYSGVANFAFNAENALKAVKKYGKDIEFALAKFSNFYGDAQFVFDENFNQIKMK